MNELHSSSKPLGATPETLILWSKSRGRASQTWSSTSVATPPLSRLESSGAPIAGHALHTVLGICCKRPNATSLPPSLERPPGRPRNGWNSLGRGAHGVEQLAPVSLRLHVGEHLRDLPVLADQERDALRLA